MPTKTIEKKAKVAVASIKCIDPIDLNKKTFKEHHENFYLVIFIPSTKSISSIPCKR